MKWPAVALTLIACLVVGCKSRPIEGKWTATSATRRGDATMTVEFKAPDKLSGTMDVPDDDGKLNIVGTYKLVGNQLTTAATDVSFEATGPQGEQNKKLFPKIKDKVLKQLNRDAQGTLRWIDDDTFTVTSGPNDTLTTFARA